ncbi:MAG: hypothetical protein Q8O05_01825 [Chloroflexota bacterium]|nr:hypothetical protein [Chloroflexota bacterium]
MIWHKRNESQVEKGRDIFTHHADRMRSFQKSHGGLFDVRGALLEAMPALRVAQPLAETGGAKAPVGDWSLVRLARVESFRLLPN